MKKADPRFLFTTVIVILLHIAFFIYALSKNNFYLLPDSIEYLNQRDNLINHGSIYQGNMAESHRWYLETRRPPLTGLLLAAIKQINHTDTAILVFQNLLSCCVLINVLVVLKNRFPGFNQLLIIPFLLLFPAQFIYTNFIMAEIFFQSAIFAALLLLLKGDKKLTGFFVFLTLAAFIKPVLYLFWIPALLLLIVFKNRLSLKTVHFTGVFFMAIVVFMYSWFNYQRTGVFAFSSASESFLPDYVALPVLHYTFGKEEALQLHDMIHEKAQQELHYAGYHRSLIRQSLEVIKEHPFTTAALWFKGIVQFFTDPGRWDVNAFQHKKTEEHQDGFFHILKERGSHAALCHLLSQGMGFTLFTLFGTVLHALLFLCFLVFLKDDSFPLLFRLMAACLVFYIALVTGMIGSARYRVAVFPVMLMAVPSGWNYLKAVFKKLLS